MCAYLNISVFSACFNGKMFFNGFDSTPSTESSVGHDTPASPSPSPTTAAAVDRGGGRPAPLHVNTPFIGGDNLAANVGQKDIWVPPPSKVSYLTFLKWFVAVLV